MKTPTSNQTKQTETDEWPSRQRLQTLLLLAATALAAHLCYLLTLPFLPSLAWALAFSVVAGPVYRWIARRIHRHEIAAGITVFIIASLVVGPLLFLARQLVVEATEAVTVIQREISSGALRSSVQSVPWLATASDWIISQIDMKGMMQRVAGNISGIASSIVAGSVEAAVQLLITFFVLFYFFRDRGKSMNVMRSILPLSRSECDAMFSRIANTINATVFGTLLVSMIQGALGGLMFWWLGVPGPILWGIVMGLLGIIPVLGAFVVWIPAAIMLALGGEWVKALILTGWGMIVIGLIDNLLYPIIVGNKLRLHTLPVFFSILGGLALFGASGLILGPVILAITDALLQIWKNRMASQDEELPASDAR